MKLMRETRSITLARFLNTTTIFFAAAFFVPFFLSGPQLLTGTVVNSLLYLSSVKLKTKDWEVMTALPSIGALLHGVVFGPLTIYLFYFLPFIWISNNILILVFRQKKIISSTAGRIFLASVFKSLFLFIVANVYFFYKVVPKIFITAMGLVQLITAVAGGFLAIIILHFIDKKQR